jgi:voltage-gated potassium channel
MAVGGSGGDEIAQGDPRRGCCLLAVGIATTMASRNDQDSGAVTVGGRTVEREEEARQKWADELLDRLTPVMGALAILFLLVVFAESMADPESTLSDVLLVAGWLLWGVFVAEFLFRLWVAPDTSAFFRKNWWQVLFLVLPFLRILRLFWAFRILRTGRVLSSAVRSSRSARGLVGNRVGWLAVISAITILGSSNLLYEFGVFAQYGEALHAAALAAITGEPLAQPDGFAQVLDVVLGVYSVIVFAALAGTVGAYFVTAGAERHLDGPPKPRIGRVVDAPEWPTSTANGG